jgi:hypothetical protein
MRNRTPQQRALIHRLVRERKPSEAYDAHLVHSLTLTPRDLEWRHELLSTIGMTAWWHRETFGRNTPDDTTPRPDYNPFAPGFPK